MFQSTYFKYYNFPFLNTGSGPIRSGKTTFLFASSHMLTFVIKDKIHSRMREIERVLYDVNFNMIINLYESTSLKHKDRIKYVLSNLITLDDFKNPKLIYNLDNIHYDYLQSKSHVKMLEHYLDLYMHSKRTDYIYSRSKIWNQVTKTYSLPFDPEWMKLKKYKDKNFIFPFDQYSVILDDEKSLDSSNIKNNGRAEDDGTDIFYRLFGHIFKENSWYFTTLQNAERWIKAEREIAQFHIYFKKTYLIGDFPKLKKLLDKLEALNQFIYNIVCNVLFKFTKRTEYQDNKNIFKKISYWILSKQEYLTSKGFILFDTNCYHDIEKVGSDVTPDKESSQAYCYEFVIPVCYVWQIGDTHAFHKPIVSELTKQSKMDRDDLGRVEIDLINVDRILTPYKEQKNKDTHNFTSTEKSINDESLEELF